jgi:Gas vesicle synthesis protein GvpO
MATTRKSTQGARRGAAKKAAPAKKAAAPAKKTAASKKAAAPTRKAAASKKAAAPSDQAAPAKKSTAASKQAAPAKKSTAASKQAAPAKKATAATKQAAPAKKATAPRNEAAPAKKAAPAKEAAARPEQAAQPGGPNGTPPLRTVAIGAAAQLAELIGRTPQAIVGVEKVDDGWRVLVEVVESRRIPETTDIMAVYEVDVSGGGDVSGYRRVSRYVRGRIEE